MDVSCSVAGSSVVVLGSMATLAVAGLALDEATLVVASRIAGVAVGGTAAVASLTVAASGADGGLVSAFPSLEGVLVWASEGAPFFLGVLGTVFLEVLAGLEALAG